MRPTGILKHDIHGCRRDIRFVIEGTGCIGVLVGIMKGFGRLLDVVEHASHINVSARAVRILSIRGVRFWAGSASTYSQERQRRDARKNAPQEKSVIGLQCHLTSPLLFRGFPAAMISTAGVLRFPRPITSWACIPE